MKWWAFFAFKYLGPLQVFLIYVGFFSRPTNRRQLWRYLNKLSKENSFIQCQRYYNLSEFNILHGPAEITIEVLKVDDDTALIFWSPSLGCADSLWWLQMFCFSQRNRYGLLTPFLHFWLVGHIGFELTFIGITLPLRWTAWTTSFCYGVFTIEAKLKYSRRKIDMMSVMFLVIIFYFYF